jgi:hypothetical protein
MIEETVSFRVVKEPYGWAVRMGRGMMTPFRSRALAIEHANGCAANLLDHGLPAMVVLEEGPCTAPVRPRRRSRFSALWS